MHFSAVFATFWLSGHSGFFYSLELFQDYELGFSKTEWSISATKKNSSSVEKAETERLKIIFVPLDN